MANIADVAGLFAKFYETQILILNEQVKLMKELEIARSSTSSNSNALIEKAETITTTDKKRKKTHEQIDPNKPKRCKTAYIIFCEENMPLVKARNPEVQGKDLMGMVAKEWKTIDAEVKKEYENKAIEDKKLFLNRMESYNQNIKDTAALEALKNKVSEEESEDQDEDDDEDDDDDEEEETQLFDASHVQSTLSIKSTATKNLQQQTNATKVNKPSVVAPSAAANQPPKVLPSASVSKSVTIAPVSSVNTHVLVEVTSPLKSSTSSTSSSSVPKVTVVEPPRPVPVSVPPKAAVPATTVPPKQKEPPAPPPPPAPAAVAVVAALEGSQAVDAEGLSEDKKKRKKKKRNSIENGNETGELVTEEPAVATIASASAVAAAAAPSENVDATTATAMEVTEEKKNKKKKKKKGSDDISSP